MILYYMLYALYIYLLYSYYPYYLYYYYSLFPQKFGRFVGLQVVAIYGCFAWGICEAEYAS